MWFTGDFVGDEKKLYKNSIQGFEVDDRSVRLSTFEEYLVRNFSAQWREDVRKTPNVILGCFRGLGKKGFIGHLEKITEKSALKVETKCQLHLEASALYFATAL